MLVFTNRSRASLEKRGNLVKSVSTTVPLLSSPSRNDSEDREVAATPPGVARSREIGSAREADSTQPAEIKGRSGAKSASFGRRSSRLRPWIFFGFFEFSTRVNWFHDRRSFRFFSDPNPLEFDTRRGSHVVVTCFYFQSYTFQLASFGCVVEGPFPAVSNEFLRFWKRKKNPKRGCVEPRPSPSRCDAKK